MFKLIPPIRSIGLERTAGTLKAATVIQSRGVPVIEELSTIPISPNLNVKPFYIHQPFLTTGVDGYDVLLRNLQLPLTKEKDIAEALVFQAEPLLPYPADQAFLGRQTLHQSSEGTNLTLIAVKKEALQAHLDGWQQIQIEPEKVACLQTALCLFAKTYLSSEKALILVHLQDETTTCVLVNAGKLIASFTHQEGLNCLSNSDESGLKRLQKAIAKMCFALNKELRGPSADGVVMTGDGVRLAGLSQELLQNLPCPIWQNEEPADAGTTSFEDKLCYAAAIGLAINSLPSQKDSVDFRQGEYGYPHPWKRILKPMIAYFACILALSATFYFFSEQSLHIQENQIKQNYVDLLADMGKSYEQFEKTFMAKNQSAREKSQGEVLPVAELNRNDLHERLEFFQKDIQSTPDTFPLFANVPRVSDVLAWLSQHPSVKNVDEAGNPQTRLQLENLHYIVVKRPEHGKKLEKYQVKVELEFSTPTPKWAREFHDALIAPNDLVDAKGEIKWNSNRGKYKTSFFLKDKTSYL